MIGLTVFIVIILKINIKIITRTEYVKKYLKYEYAFYNDKLIKMHIIYIYS